MFSIAPECYLITNSKNICVASRAFMRNGAGRENFSLINFDTLREFTLINSKSWNAWDRIISVESSSRKTVRFNYHDCLSISILCVSFYFILFFCCCMYWRIYDAFQGFRFTRTLRKMLLNEKINNYNLALAPHLSRSNLHMIIFAKWIRGINNSLYWKQNPLLEAF